MFDEYPDQIFAHKYIIMRKLRLNKLKIRQGIRAKRYEVKVNNMEENRWVKKYTFEKIKNN